MSIDVMNRIWWRTDLAMTEKFIALALADASNDEGVSWPAVDTIAEKCSCTRRTVQNAVTSLCDKGLLRKMERKDRSNYYVFNMAALPVFERVRRPKEAFDDPSRNRGAADAPQLFDTGESGSMRGAFRSMTGESGSMRGESPAPRTVIEPSIEPSESDSGDLASPADVGLTNFVQCEWEALKEEFPGIAGIRRIDDSLAKQIQLRAKQHGKPGEDPIAVWRTVFSEIRASQFLLGRAPPAQGRDVPFKLSLGWLCQSQKFREVINGRYNSDRGNNRSYDASGKRLGPTGQAVAGSLERMRSARQRG